jgi:hypothetical protein
MNHLATALIVVPPGLLAAAMLWAGGNMRLLACAALAALLTLGLPGGGVLACALGGLAFLSRTEPGLIAEWRVAGAGTVRLTATIARLAAPGVALGAASWAAFPVPAPGLMALLVLAF